MLSCFREREEATENPISHIPRTQESTVAEWGRDLYEAAPMPDKRLNPRLVNMAAHLAQKPTDPITQAFDDPADVKAAYRCIENKRVRPVHLRRAFSQKTVRDATGHRALLAIQDSVTLSFPRAPATEGLGLISDTDIRGLIAHSTLLATLEGMPIGLVVQDVWSRGDKREETREQRQRLPIEEKESYKWIHGMREARRSFAGQLPPEQRPGLIHIFDREGDVHEVIEDAVRHGEGCVIRSTQNRRARAEDGRLAGAHPGGERALVGCHRGADHAPGRQARPHGPRGNPRHCAGA